MGLPGAQQGIFQGRGDLLELRHFDKKRRLKENFQ